MTTRAVIYARVSSVKQRDAHTIENQLRELPALVARRGWTMVATPETYVDDGKSAKAGRLDKRPGLLRLLADAVAGKFDVVCVVDADRLTRADDLAERGKILGAFQAAGVRVVSLTSGDMDLRTFEGQLTASLTTLLAAQDNLKRAERVKHGRATAIARGRKPAGKTPYGLRWDNTSKEWSIDPVEGPIVVEIYTRIADGDSCEAIARDFTARRVARRQGGKRWLREQVHTIARSRTYVGEWVADTKTGAVVNVPAIVERKLWQAANEAMRVRGARMSSRTIGRVTYLLQGLATCAECGAAINVYAGSTSRDARFYHHPRYICAHRRRMLGDQRCEAPTLRVDEVDERLWSQLVSILRRPDVLERALAIRATKGDESRAWGADLKEWRRKLRKLDDVEDAVSSQHRRGTLSARGYAKELEAIKREREMLTRQIETAEQAVANVAARAERMRAATALVDELRDRIDTVDKATQRRIVQLLVRDVAIGGSGIRGTLRLQLPIDDGELQGASGSACRTGRGLHLIDLPLVA